jgi:hypothetical protein
MFKINTMYNKDLMTDTVVVEFRNEDQHIMLSFNVGERVDTLEEFLVLMEGAVNKVAEQVH